MITTSRIQFLAAHPGRYKDNATPAAKLGSTGVQVEDLKPTHNIGEHLSATRRQFGLIP